jgi:hypothetical protein
MLTKIRFSPPGLTGKWNVDGPNLILAISNYFLVLNQKSALEIDEARIRAAQGVAFPATQVDATDANTLDDYEEGTWTPTDGSGAALVLVVDHAIYTKIGRHVFGQAKITYPATASGATAQINGLPFASAKQTAAAAGSDGGNVTWAFVSGSSISPEPVNAGGILNSALSGKTLWINFSYYV